MLKDIENDLVDLLGQVKEVFDEHNVEFWLECGTLLGTVRNGKFISWEHDLDFGAWHKKVPEALKNSVSKAFCDRGFKVWIAENHMNIKREGELWADVNFYRLDNNGNAVKPTLCPKNLFGKFLRVWHLAEVHKRETKEAGNTEWLKKRSITYLLEPVDMVGLLGLI